MQKKLAVLFFLVLLAFAGLSVRLALINRDNGEQYKKQVLSQQQYDSITIPFKRGDIIDCKGTKLAVSEKVYNIVLDAKQLTAKAEYLDPTMKALHSCFRLDEAPIRAFLKENPTSQYNVLKKQLTYDEISPFVELQNDPEQGELLKGIWFEEEYRRTYPNGNLASDAIGFTGKDNIGTYGMEEFYNDTLNGINGRQYGYLNDDSTLERTTKAAIDGNTIVSTIDANIQSIVEKYLKKFNEEHKNAARDGNGAVNTACIMMRVNTGEILAMANYPNYDLNDTKNPHPLIGSILLDKDGKPTEEIITEETLKTIDDETLYANLNALWKNFCISSSYEPGSVAKPFTVAAGLESGRLTGNETYFCNGSLWYGGHEIHCHNRLGDGLLTVKQAVEKSCNVALMQMGDAIGKNIFLQFQNAFNFGLKTNIDLAGETRNDSLVYNAQTMGEAELATSTFGQGFNATMIQMICGFCSLINGGNYYEPHIVSKIVSPDGVTVRNIEPRILKQTISPSTSDKIIDYCNGVVTEGTGKTARPAGYAIGGKTGTAEMVPRNKRNYLVSFMGYAPAERPEIAIYVIVDRPNAPLQDDAKFATGIVRNILTEVLPYMNYFMTEELSEKEESELEETGIYDSILHKVEEAAQTEGEDGSSKEKRQDGAGNGDDKESVEVIKPGEGGQELSEEEKKLKEMELSLIDKIKGYAVDPETGYLVEPGTGVLIDPNTGAAVDGASFENE
ncbi:MAG: cell division protein FtsI [Lachnospiraceae bacterium]|nr:cell division protein FtsI [Lachnospiraceae bacterium]